MTVILDFLVFIVKVLTNWTTWLSSAVFIWGIFAFILNWNNVPRYLIFIVGFLFIFIYCFNVWRDTYSQNILTGNINFISLGNLSQDNAGLILNVSVTNGGTESNIAEGYKLSIVGPQATVTNISPTVFPDASSSDPIVIDGKKTSFEQKEAIYEKTNSSIAPRSKVTGWLYYRIENINATKIRIPGTKIIITYLDINHRTKTIEYSITGKGGQVQYFPGTNQPFQ